MTDADSSDGGKFSYRTPFYQKLKQLNTDICTFMVQSQGVKIKGNFQNIKIDKPSISESSSPESDFRTKGEGLNIKIMPMNDDKEIKTQQKRISPRSLMRFNSEYRPALQVNGNFAKLITSLDSSAISEKDSKPPTPESQFGTPVTKERIIGRVNTAQNLKLLGQRRCSRQMKKEKTVIDGDENCKHPKITRALNRKQVYEKIFFGHKLEHKEMFANPGFRGIKVLPYPKHIKKLIEDVSPDKKKSGNIFYQGYEIVDEKIESEVSQPWARSSCRQLYFDQNGKLKPRTGGSSRNLFEVAFQKFEQSQLQIEQQNSTPQSKKITQKLESPVKSQIYSQTNSPDRRSMGKIPNNVLFEDFASISESQESLSNDPDTITEPEIKIKLTSGKKTKQQKKIDRQISQQQKIFNNHQNQHSRKIYQHIYGDKKEEQQKLEQNKKIMENIRLQRKQQEQYQKKIISQKYQKKEEIMKKTKEEAIKNLQETAKRDWELKQKKLKIIQEYKTDMSDSIIRGSLNKARWPQESQHDAGSNTSQQECQTSIQFLNHPVPRTARNESRQNIFNSSLPSTPLKIYEEQTTNRCTKTSDSNRKSYTSGVRIFIKKQNQKHGINEMINSRKHISARNSPSKDLLQSQAQLKSPMMTPLVNQSVFNLYQSQPGSLKKKGSSPLHIREQLMKSSRAYVNQHSQRYFEQQQGVFSEISQNSLKNYKRFNQ